MNVIIPFRNNPSFFSRSRGGHIRGGQLYVWEVHILSRADGLTDFVLACYRMSFPNTRLWNSTETTAVLPVVAQQRKVWKPWAKPVGTALRPINISSTYCRQTQSIWPSWSSRCPKAGQRASWNLWFWPSTTMHPTSEKSFCSWSFSRLPLKKKSGEALIRQLYMRKPKHTCCFSPVSIINMVAWLTQL